MGLISIGANPFASYPGEGRRLLGRPKRGDETARHGYGPPVFQLCGLACVYCGLDMSKPYANWLHLSVDHVIPAGARTLGYPQDWLEDLANLVTCCRPCNEFSNAFAVTDPTPVDLETFFAIRDRAWAQKRAVLAEKQATEQRWYEVNVVGRGLAVGPDLPAEPTP